MNLLSELGTLGRSCIALAGAGFVVMVLAFAPSPLGIVDLFDQVQVVEIKSPTIVKAAAMPASAAFEAITARPLFNRERKPDPVPPPPEPPKPAIVLGDVSQFRVEGLVTTNETQLALVRKSGAQLLRLKPGDTVEGWKVDSIDIAKGVSISGGDRSEVLKIPKAANRAAPP